MKTFIKLLKLQRGLRLCEFAFIVYDDDSCAVRKDGSGLMSPVQKLTVGGINRLLAWIESEVSA